MKTYLLLLATIVLCSLQCRKTPRPPATDIPGLPPATQTGANTLGFLLNGQPWTPQGSNGTANLSIDFDPGIDNGILGILGYRVLNASNSSQIVLGIRDSLNFIKPPQSYRIGKPSMGGLIFSDQFFCTRDSDDNTNFCEGFIRIQKLDRINRIISGSFECKLFNPSCGDTIKITNGRFDMKF